MINYFRRQLPQFSAPNCKFAPNDDWAITPQQLKCTLRLLSPYSKPKLEVIYGSEIVQYNSRYHSITVRPPQLYNFHKLSKNIFLQRIEISWLNHEKTTPLIVSYINYIINMIRVISDPTDKQTACWLQAVEKYCLGLWSI